METTSPAAAAHKGTVVGRFGNTTWVAIVERRECAATRTASPKDAVVLAGLTEPKTTEGAYLFRREEKKVVIA